MVVDSVIRWIDKGMKNDYQFANNQSGAQVDRGRQMSPSPRSTAEEHEQQNRMDTTELHTDEISSPARSTLPAELAKDKEVSGSTTLISLQDDLTKLFTHVSLERLQQDLKSYQTNQGKLSNQHYASKSDDEDSFYSAASDSLTDDSLSSKVQAVIDSLEGKNNNANTQVYGKKI
ncbi:hypothetical protein BCR42DRAFT_106228 [Absidia repens]|uniref:Uncharacterized protein n=1 Tax=Absidia repens TaxID=90262 RepID=A0A1X2I779_9FUNG|nr:hypothetical protein BCR42DRAFT_106228 [Absidia repens]